MDHSVTELTERLEKVLQESVGNGPLIEKKLRNEIRIRDLKWALKSIVTILILVSGFNFCVPIYPHIRAISRIGLIKLAPYWDWSDYYQRDCLLERIDEPSSSSFQSPDCLHCEDLFEIESIENVSSRFLMDGYVSQTIPVIVSDGALDWPLLRDPDLNLDFIAKAYQDDDSGWGTCRLESNVRISNLDEFFVLLERFSPEKSWFAHWENCGRASVKTGRRFYPRPYFITAAVDLSFNNWVLVSNRYRAKNYKQIKLRSSGLAMLAQVRGITHVRLLPDQNCYSECSVINFTLMEGEIVLLNPKYWKLEYHPGENSFNMALIIQGEVD